MSFKQIFVHTPHGPLFGMYYSENAYFENNCFYYNQRFLDLVKEGDICAKELWAKAYTRRMETGMPMYFL
jgi:hypothetical protein